MEKNSIRKGEKIMLKKMPDKIMDIVNSLIDDVLKDFISSVKEDYHFKEILVEIDIIGLEMLLISSQRKALAKLTNEMKGK